MLYPYIYGCLYIWKMKKMEQSLVSKHNAADELTFALATNLSHWAIYDATGLIHQ